MSVLMVVLMVLIEELVVFCSKGKMTCSIATYRTMHANYIIHIMMYAIQLYRCTYMKSVRYQIEQWQRLQGSEWITIIHWHLKTHSPQFL